MRMYKPLSCLMALFVGAAFAADGIVPSRLTTVTGTQSFVTNSRTTSSRQTSATAASRGTSTRTTANGNNASAGVTSRGTSSRVVANTNVRQRGETTSSTARRASVARRPSVAEYGGRATIYGTNQQTGSNIGDDIRKVTGRATTKTATKESIVEAKEVLEQTAELNKSCQEQYNECMDQFCAVIDANQKRCSCSANLSKYKKVEDAVNEANTKLNEVAQNIRYIGLSADEIRAIMTATEAEEAMTGVRDTTENRNLLEQIEAMIRDPQTTVSSYNTSTEFGLDMDLDFSSDPIDIFSLDFLANASTTSFSNLRGSDLYNAAKKRCNTVLNQCKKAGATAQQVTGNYDLAIDKDCIAYENGLKKMNETLVSNVRSAERMLQKARLAVLQNKNQYDAKGCVGALEACMTDEMVCGENYAKCIDPTKRYIDENGNVVLGQDVTRIQAFMTAYDNSKTDDEFLKSAYEEKEISEASCASHGDSETGGDGACTVKYLLQKIGTKQKVTDEGLCRAVLDKCQAYTYDGKKYKSYNDIVVNYIQRAMVNIKAAQQQIISDYATTCMVNVSECYNQQITQINSWTSSANADNVYNIMRGACRSVALSCGLAIFVGEPVIKQDQTLTIGDQEYTVSGCSIPAGAESDTAAYNNAIVNCVSDMFYQTLICPDNSMYDDSNTGEVIDANDTPGGWVNKKCKCMDGYVVWSGYCVLPCGEHAHRESGRCVCDNAYKGDGYSCALYINNLYLKGDLVIEKSGKLVADIPISVKEFLSCVAGQEKVNGKCVDICGSGETRNSETGECEASTPAEDPQTTPEEDPQTTPAEP